MTTPAALVLALPAAPATSSSDAAASLAMVATSSSRAISPEGMAGRLGELAAAQPAIRALRRAPCWQWTSSRRTATTVERAIRDKGVDARPRRAARARRARCARSRPRSRRCAPSATRSARSSRTPRPKRRPSSASRPRRPARARRRAGERARREGRRAEGADAALPGHSLRRRAGRARRELQHRHPHRGRAAEVRLRAARPCRADREERLGRSVRGSSQVSGSRTYCLKGRAGAARDQADGLGAGADRRAPASRRSPCRRSRASRPSSTRASSPAIARKPTSCPTTICGSPAPPRWR